MIVYGMADGIATGFIRLSIPLAAIAKLGHTVSAGSHPEQLPDGADVWVGQRINGLGPSVVWQECAAREGRSTFMIYELDDDVWDVPPWSGVASAWHQIDRLDRVRENIRVSDRVIVSTDYLADRVHDETGHRDIVVHPNTLPRVVFDWPDVLPPERNGNTVTLGWAGSSTHERDFAVAAPAVRAALAAERGRVELHTIGHDYAGDYATGLVFGIPRLSRIPSERMAGVFQWTRHSPWFRRVDRYWRRLDFHVGLLPLADDHFNLSKSNIKALEYGARGIPSVASPVGPYASYFDDAGRSGAILARSERQWRRALDTLIHDEPARLAMGARARSCAMRYVAEDWAAHYVEAITPR